MHRTVAWCIHQITSLYYCMRHAIKFAEHAIWWLSVEFSGNDTRRDVNEICVVEPGHQLINKGERAKQVFLGNLNRFAGTATQGPIQSRICAYEVIRIERSTV